MPASLPPPRRSILFPLAILVAGAVWLAFWSLGHSSDEIQTRFSEACALACLLSAWACLGRIARGGPERRGWLILGTAQITYLAANVLMALAPAHPALRGPWNLGILLPSFATLALVVAALLSWPWHSERSPRNLQHALGSILFVGSLLLALETLGTWGQSFHSARAIHAALLGTACRFSILTGLGLYLLAQNPRRLRGALGFILAYGAVAGIYVVVLQAELAFGCLALVPLACLPALAPLLFGLAAWSGAPVESPAPEPDAERNLDLLPYGPFIIAGVAVLAEEQFQRASGSVPVLGFISLTGVLVLRQFLLHRELKQANAFLEERVLARTRDLDTIQAMLLRNERLNTVAILGAGITHDLNNLLGVVRASAELAEEEGGLLQGPGALHLRRINAATDQAAALTKRLMGFVRKETELPTVLSLALEMVHLEELIRILLPRTVALRMEAAHGLFHVLTCRTNLEQVMVNLVSNARDAMPTGGTITVCLDGVHGSEGYLARIQVTDTGPGLPDEVQAHLFEPFITTKELGQGTGLGLASVKALVNGDGGTVEVESRKGLGCTFTVCYPLASLS